jgi:hypothetical protein
LSELARTRGRISFGPGLGSSLDRSTIPSPAMRNAALRQYGDQMFQRRFAPLVAAP